MRAGRAAVIAATILLAGCKPASRKPAESAQLPILPPVVVPAPPVPEAPPGGFSRRLAAGTPITVSLGSLVDSSVTRPGFIGGSVTDDVKGLEGRTAIPAGSPATIYVRTSKRTGPISEVRMGLYAVNVAGHEFSLSTGAREPANLVFTEDAQKGFVHNVVHLQYGSRVVFRLEAPVQLR